MWMFQTESEDRAVAVMSAPEEFKDYPGQKEQNGHDKREVSQNGERILH